MAEVHREDAEALQVLDLQPTNVHIVGMLLHRPHGARRDHHGTQIASPGST
jgi:hypothetical protein